MTANEVRLSKADVPTMRREQEARAVRIRKAVLIADIARQFCTIDHQLASETNPDPGLPILSMQLRHDLYLLCDIPCGCDEGTCPGLMTR